MGEARNPYGYSDEEKRRALDVLEANEGNLSKTSRETGIPRPTIRRWMSLNRNPIDEQFERLAYQLIGIVPEKMDKANLQQVIGALRMVLDRMDRVKYDEEEAGDVYERLAHLISRYAPDRAAVGDLASPEEV